MSCYLLMDTTNFFSFSLFFKCTASCGVGMQMRNVMCAKKEGAKILRILSNDQCNKGVEMSGVQKCSIRPCQAGWYIYPWNAVSKTGHVTVFPRDRATMCPVAVRKHVFQGLICYTSILFCRFSFCTMQ